MCSVIKLGALPLIYLIRLRPPELLRKDCLKQSPLSPRFHSGGVITANNAEMGPVKTGGGNWPKHGLSKNNSVLHKFNKVKTRILSKAITRCINKQRDYRCPVNLRPP